MIILKNPKTDSYKKFKTFICSDEFPWYWNNSIYNDDNNPSDVAFYTHVFLGRPEMSKQKICNVQSNLFEKCCEILLEILDFNEVSINYFLRINANCTHPHLNVINCKPHVDHSFYHRNMVIYLTNAGGKITVDNVPHLPNEDDVVMFDGKDHYFETPKIERRIVLVSTFV